MDNPEKLATYGTQDEDKQSKNTTQYVLGTTKVDTFKDICSDYHVYHNKTSFNNSLKFSRCPFFFSETVFIQYIYSSTYTCYKVRFYNVLQIKQIA